MKTLRLPVKTQWFEITKAGIKKEDYREITPYWIKRFVENDIDLTIDEIKEGLFALSEGHTEDHVYEVYGVSFKIFNQNQMTLGYPKTTDTKRIISLEHKGIEIGYGNPEWGAEPNKLYFIIKHGEIL